VKGRVPFVERDSRLEWRLFRFLVAPALSPGAGSALAPVLRV